MTKEFKELLKDNEALCQIQYLLKCESEGYPNAESPIDRAYAERMAKLEEIIRKELNSRTT